MTGRISGSRDVVGRTIQIPNGAMIRHVSKRTVVEYNGEILFTFDPMEENQ